MRGRLIVCGIALIALVGSPAQAERFRNLNEAFAPAHAELVNGSCDIVFLGDSLTFGQVGPAYRTLMHAQSGNGGQGYSAAARGQGAVYDNNWNEAPLNTDASPHRGVNGMWISYSPILQSQATLWASNRYTRVHYVAEPGGGTFEVVPPCGSPVVLESSSPLPEVREYTFNFGSAGEAALVFRPVGDGPVTILGQTNVNLTAGSRVHICANGGWGVNNFLQRDWTFDAQLPLLTPDLILVMLGQNDQGNTQATYADKMRLLVQRLRAATPNTQIVLISTYDSGSPNLAPLAAAMDQVSLELATGFINLYEVGGTYEQYLLRGYVSPDGVHLSPAGGAFVAALIYDALQSGGVSLIPCRDVDFNNDQVYPDIADLDLLLNVFSGGPCPVVDCDSIDFNQDGIFPDLADLEAFLRVFAGGDC